MSSLHCPICFQEYIQYISIKAVHTYCLFILTFLQQVSLKMIVLKLTFEYYKPPTTKILISHGKNITHLRNSGYRITNNSSLYICITA